MPMGRPVCWDPAQVREVIKSDGEVLPDAVFAAVDSPYDLWQVGADRAQSRLPRAELLNQFVSPLRENLKVVVLGDAGSGKSHLIKWLEVELRRNQAIRDAYILSIPRAGVSLRGILSRIIGVLPADEQERHRRKLEAARYDFEDEVQRRASLLSFIALAILADRPQPINPSKPSEAEHRRHSLEQWLIGRAASGGIAEQGLSCLFEDSYLKPRWINDDSSIITRIVDHVVQERAGHVPRDESLTFTEADLPLAGNDVRQMARPAQQVVRQLATNAEAKVVALDLINRNLRPAITRMLNFTGEDLVNLMTEVRQSLKRRGRWLILLIEDLARLEGMDMPLLEALIQPTRDDLCQLRWALAVTTGYYDNARPTVGSRVQADGFVINMDVPTTGDQAVVDEVTRVAFAARYLNAIRVGVPGLTAWYERSNAEGAHDPPNPCMTCNDQAACHEAFGAVSGVGLYPYNGQAITNILDFRDGESAQRFNPRKMLSEVIAEPLADHAEEIAAQRFPSVDYHTRIVPPGHGLRPADVERLTRADPGNAPRQRAILELWGRPRELTVLPDELYRSFGVPSPDLDRPPVVRGVQAKTAHEAGHDGVYIRSASRGEWLYTTQPIDNVTVYGFVDADDVEISAVGGWQVTTYQESGYRGPQQQTFGPFMHDFVACRVAVGSMRPRLYAAPQQDSPLLDAVQVWGTGGGLDEDATGKLRNLLYRAIVERIDWNSLGIARGHVTGGARQPFRAGLINFRGQQSRLGEGDVTLLVPAEDDPQARLQAALAIEGLVRFEQERDWEFDDGMDRLVQLAGHLDQWAYQITQQIRRLPDGRGAWNPAPLAVELLTIGAAIAAQEDTTTAALPKFVNDLFREAAWPASAPLSGAWREIHQAISAERSTLLGLVTGWAATGNKGARDSAFFDPLLVAQVVDGTRANWRLRAMPPHGDTPTDDRCKVAVRLAQQVTTKLEKAANELLEQAQTWAENVRPHLDDVVGRAGLLATLEKLRTLALPAGVIPSPEETSRIDAALAELRTLDLDAAVTAVSTAVARPPLRAWPLLVPHRIAEAIDKSAATLRAIDRFMQAVENEVRAREANCLGEHGIAEVQSEIRANLDALDLQLAEIGGGDGR